MCEPQLLRDYSRKETAPDKPDILKGEIRLQTQKLWFEDLETDENRALPWTLQRDSAALLLVDLENELLEEGAIMEVPDGRRIIPTVKRLLEACRGLGVPVIYTRMVHQSARVAPRIYELFPYLEGKAYVPGSKGVEIYPEVRPAPEEPVVDKTQYSAFFGTNLEDVIRSIKADKGAIDTLIFAGVVSHVCVDCTLRDAFYRGYRVVLVEDGCAGWDSAMHEATVFGVRTLYGRVSSCEGVLQDLRST